MAYLQDYKADNKCKNKYRLIMRHDVENVGKLENKILLQSLRTVWPYDHVGRLCFRHSLSYHFYHQTREIILKHVLMKYHRCEMGLLLSCAYRASISAPLKCRFTLHEVIL